MKAKVSAIVRSDACGLGTLSRMFSDYLGFHRTLSIARHKGGAWPEWYGQNNREANDGLTPEDIAWACEGADVLLSFETWYGERTPAIAKALGVKTALMPMYECCPLRGSGLEDTDLAICPSNLDLFEANCTPGLSQAVKDVLPVPFDTARIPFRQRERALTFLHNAGHGGIGGRNSTLEVLEAWRYVKSPAKLIVRVQPGMSMQVEAPKDSRISFVECNPENYWELFDEGDVLLHPTKWDALSLPIQEALTAGMPVMTTRYWPFCNEHIGLDCRMGWLPHSIQAMAIPVDRCQRMSVCRPINVYYTSPLAIAAQVELIYGRQIDEESRYARQTAECWSWEELRKSYDNLFYRLASNQL